jgi:hypothetical protein
MNSGVCAANQLAASASRAACRLLRRPTPSSVKNSARENSASVKATQTALATETRNESGPTGSSAKKAATSELIGAPGGCGTPRVRAAAMNVPSS